MVAPLVLAGIGAGASVLGGIAGEVWAGADERERKRLEEKAAALYGNVSAPALERVIAEELGPSAMEGVQVDAGARQARKDALRKMMEVGLSGGMDAESQLAAEQARMDAAQYERGQRQAILQNARMRGTAGGGQELAAQLQGQQSGANRAHLGGLQAAADARRRALQALAQGGEMAGGLERDDFGQKATRAEAQDAISRFNAQNRQQANLYNAGLGQQDFENRLAVKDRQAEALYRQADAAGRKGDRKRRIAGGIGSGANYGLTAYGQYGSKP